jgi:alanine racemase
MRPASAMIDLVALRHNLACVRRAAPHAKIMAVVKANGYGHGAVRVARALRDVDALAVSCLEEAVVLRDAGEQRPIVLLEGFFDVQELEHIAALNLDMVLHHRWQVDALARTWTSPHPVFNVWLKIDTGMHRLGVLPEEVAPLVLRLTQLAAVRRPLRFMTHFACADDPQSAQTQQQWQRFDALTQSLPGDRSAANSAGIFAAAMSHADWVRPGIALYGSSPLQGTSAQTLGLLPSMTLTTRLIAVEHRRVGDCVGYGATWCCPRDMRVGVAAIGYGDGYPRHAQHGTPVLVQGVRTELVGRVSMDMITIDLDAVPQADVGDVVTLWGSGLSADEVATSAGTIAYELFCGVASRVRFEERDG